MPKYYSLHFKEVAIDYYNSSKLVKIKDVLSIFRISNGSLFNWKNLKKINNLRENKKTFKNHSKFTPQIKCYIREYVIKRINFDYKLLIRQIKRKFNICISKSS